MSGVVKMSGKFKKRPLISFFKSFISQLTSFTHHYICLLNFLYFKTIRHKTIDITIQIEATPKPARTVE